ncbi:hypothetical protein L6R49_15855 [Myxococcota bacterium]|nr:hypothetical protein [Myxococcota bacterium]
MSDQAVNDLVVVDLGKHKKKSIKRLRRGEGGLMEDVQDVVAEVKAGLKEGEATPVIVVVVREKADKMKMPGLMMR